MPCPTFRNLRSLLLLVVAALGCTVEETPHRDAGVPGDDAPTTADTPPFRVDSPTIRPTYVALRIAPASVVLPCDGEQAFEAFLVADDGSEMRIDPLWETGSSRLGTVSVGGLFTPRPGCRASGSTELRASVSDGRGGTLEAAADVTVRIELPPLAEGTLDLAEAEAAFGSPEGGTAPSVIAYPLDGALLPNNIVPIDVQWGGGVSGDLYRVSLESGSFRLVAYLAHGGAGFGYHWVAPRELWQLVAENDDDGLDLRVDRWNAATDTVTPGAPVHFRMTRSSIAGAVYYWGLHRECGGAGGEFDRIAPASATFEQLIPSPPTAGGGGVGCVGCHTVSRDGRLLAANLNGGSGGPSDGGAVFDLSEDLTTSPAPTVFPTWPRGDRFWFSAAFNPDATRLFITSSYAIVIDPSDGTTVPATGLPPRDTTGYFYSVDWSPDGNLVATTHIDPSTASWGHKFTHGDLVTIAALPDDAFGPMTVLHAGDDLTSSPEGGRVDVHPAFAPDSQYVVFQHGTSSRTIDGSGDSFCGTTWASSALYLISRDGSSLIRLDRAMGGAHGHRDYWPTFAPFSSVEPDGTIVWWVAFTSARDYGNAEVGTAAAPAEYGRQIWVTALTMPDGELTGPITEDPSHVPFWLPGQNTAHENMGAYWAALSCRDHGSGCELSSECCSGYCAPDTTGLTCQPPPPDRCRTSAESCGSDADCCGGLTCLGNTCVLEAPM